MSGEAVPSKPPRRRKRESKSGRWSGPRPVTEAVSLYAQGLSIRAVAIRLGCGYGMINSLLHDAGVTLRPKTPTTERSIRVDAAEVELARRVREQRERRNLTQLHVATMIGISRRAMSSIETGHRRVSAQDLWHLAQVLATSIEALLGMEGVGVRDETVCTLLSVIDELSAADRVTLLMFAKSIRAAGGKQHD